MALAPVEDLEAGGGGAVGRGEGGGRRGWAPVELLGAGLASAADPLVLEALPRREALHWVHNQHLPPSPSRG